MPRKSPTFIKRFARSVKRRLDQLQILNPGDTNNFAEAVEGEMIVSGIPLRQKTDWMSIVSNHWHEIEAEKKYEENIKEADRIEQEIDEEKSPYKDRRDLDLPEDDLPSDLIEIKRRM